MVLDDRLRQMVLDGASTSAVADTAAESGMSTLRSAGLRAIYDGLTTVEEVIRESMSG
jgi:type IV pilus assembly protein PilB